MANYNYVPDGKGGYLEVPTTPEPQSIQVKAGKAAARVSALAAEAAGPAMLPAVQVLTIDGQPTAILRGSNDAGTGQQVSPEDLAALGVEPDAFPVCEYPGCKDEGRYQIIAGSAKPLSINRKGQLVFGDLAAMPEAGMSAVDKARAKAGLSGVVGPSGQMGFQMPKCHVDVCLRHQNLPHAPKDAPKRYRSGPYPSYVSARRRVHEVGMRTGQEPSVFSVKRGGVDAWFVDGDDGVKGFKGSCALLP